MASGRNRVDIDHETILMLSTVARGSAMVRTCLNEVSLGIGLNISAENYR